MRIATANTYDTALEQLFKRQSDLALQQEKLSTGLRVNRSSDDPTAAALAERARVRLSRIEVDQRALEAQRSALATAETSLGEAVSLVQGVRELAISAGNAMSVNGMNRVLPSVHAVIRPRIGITMKNAYSAKWNRCDRPACQIGSTGVMRGAPCFRRCAMRTQTRMKMPMPSQKCVCIIAKRAGEPRSNRPRCSMAR